MNNTKLYVKLGLCYLSCAIANCFADNNDKVLTQKSAKTLYSTADIGKMIPLKLSHAYDSFWLALGGSAIRGNNPDKTFDVLVDSGSTILVIPEDYVNPKKVTVLEECVVDYWGNIDDLVQGQVSLQSTDKSINYAVESYTFYRVRNITHQCKNVIKNTEKTALNPKGPYYIPGTALQRQMIIGTGTQLANTIYSKKYCIGGIFNFIDYSKYSPNKQAIFSFVSFGNAQQNPPNPEKNIPFLMQTYISVGIADRGHDFNYTLMPTAKLPSTRPCPELVHSSWNFSSRIPASISVNNTPLQLALNKTPKTSNIPYLAVDSAGGSLRMRDSIGNPNINALHQANVLMMKHPIQLPNGSICYGIKPGVAIDIQLHPMNSPVISTLYSYTTQKQSWGAYQASICEYGKKRGGNLGFSLFYAANTISFDFTNQRLGISLGPITPPAKLNLPK